MNIMDGKIEMCAGIGCSKEGDISTRNGVWYCEKCWDKFGYDFKKEADNED